MDDKIFDKSVREFERQYKSRTVSCDSNTPIYEGETIDACIRGGQKAKTDSEKKEFIRALYVGGKH